MKRTFIQTEAFDKAWHELGLGDDELAQLQRNLMLHPDTGDIIIGTGGARKVRIPLQGRGKSGGARVIYVDIIVKQAIFLLMAYAKNTQTDLTPDQKKMVRKMVKILREE